jgi:hypothetical protein
MNNNLELITVKKPDKLENMMIGCHDQMHGIEVRE